MVDTFEDLLLETSSRPSAVVSLWTTAVCEVFSVAMPSQLGDTRVFAAAISLLLSFFLAWFFFRSVG
jgi:hypothetical protein